MTLRSTTLVWHRWFGLIAGCWIMLLAVTGSVLVFRHEIDRALNADMMTVATGGMSLSLDALRRMAEDGAPGLRLQYLDLPDHPDDTAMVLLHNPQEDGQLLQMYLDPRDGNVLGTRSYGEWGPDRRRLIPLILSLHTDLLLGEITTWLLGLLALLWALNHVAGALLAFLNVVRWRASFRIRKRASGYALYFDLHRVIGLWLLPITLMLAGTGLYFNWMKSITAAIETVSARTPHPAEMRSPLGPMNAARPPVSMDQAAAIAIRSSGARIEDMSLAPAQGIYWFQLFDPNDVGTAGRRALAIDMRTGNVLADWHAARGSGADVLDAWMFPLHAGTAFGWPGRSIILLCGVGICGIFSTGIYLWWKKRAMRRKTVARRQAIY